MPPALRELLLPSCDANEIRTGPCESVCDDEELCVPTMDQGLDIASGVKFQP